MIPLRQGRVLNLDGLLPKYQPGVAPATQGALGAPYLLPDETSMPPRSDGRLIAEKSSAEAETAETVATARRTVKRMMYSLCQTMNDVCDYVKGEASNWGLVRLHPPFIHFLDIKGGKRPLDWFQLCPWPLPTDISGWYLSVIPEFTPRKNLRINQIDAKVLCSREHALLHIPQAQARTILFRERRAPSVMTCTGANNVKKDGLLPHQEVQYPAVS